RELRDFRTVHGEVFDGRSEQRCAPSRVAAALRGAPESREPARHLTAAVPCRERECTSGNLEDAFPVVRLLAGQTLRFVESRDITLLLEEGRELRVDVARRPVLADEVAPRGYGDCAIWSAGRSKLRCAKGECPRLRRILRSGRPVRKEVGQTVLVVRLAVKR